MQDTRYDFQPMRVDHGDEVNILVGCSGELLRIDANGTPMHESVTPFPANISDGVVIGESWIGTWVDPELREARMAALPLVGNWEDGAGRQQLREYSNSEILMPASSIWSRRLDAEPMALTLVSNGVIFATLNRGIYMIDEEARELWRTSYPQWPSLTKFQYSDTLVSCTEFDDRIAVWSRSGAVTILDAKDGSFISNQIVSLTGPLAGVEYSKDGGWFLILENGGICLLSDLQDTPQLVDTPGPVFDARFSIEGWKWTGWRHDGNNTGQKSETVNRQDIGIALVGDNVITNDGRWDKFRA